MLVAGAVKPFTRVHVLFSPLYKFYPRHK